MVLFLGQNGTSNKISHTSAKDKLLLPVAKELPNWLATMKLQQITEIRFFFFLIHCKTYRRQSESIPLTALSSSWTFASSFRRLHFPTRRVTACNTHVDGSIENAPSPSHNVNYKEQEWRIQPWSPEELLKEEEKGFAAALHISHQPADERNIILLVQQIPLLLWRAVTLSQIYPLSLPLTEKLNFPSTSISSSNFHLFHPPLYTVIIQVYFERV